MGGVLILGQGMLFKGSGVKWDLKENKDLVGVSRQKVCRQVYATASIGNARGYFLLWALSYDRELGDWIISGHQSCLEPVTS